jgi:hypothetical protein
LGWYMRNSISQSVQRAEYFQPAGTH